MWKKFLLKNLPFILDYATFLIRKSLHDEKETKLDKAVSFLIKDETKEVIDKFYEAYNEAIVNLK